jgi:hypothetical protein
MNCRHATTRLRSSQVAGRMPQGPELEQGGPGDRRDDGGVGGDDRLGSGGGQVVQLRHGRHARGPRRLIDPQARAGQEGPDRAGVELLAVGHAPMMPGRKDIYAERRWCVPPLMP